MDTKDRSDMNLPARVTSVPVPAVPVDAGASLQIAPSTISPSVLGRGLLRHWWKILGLWLILSIPAVLAIYSMVQPTYEAVSTLRIEPVTPDPYGSVQASYDLRGVDQYLSTQIGIIKSDMVLKPAVAMPPVVGLPLISRSTDPVADLRKKLDVSIVEGTFLIRVALESTDREEAAAIVRAVVLSYVQENAKYMSSNKGNLKASLTGQITKVDEAIEKAKKELDDLSKKGTVKISKPKLTLGTPGSSQDSTNSPSFSSVDEAHYNQLVDQFAKTQIQFYEVEAKLETRRAAERAKEEQMRLNPASIDPDLEAKIIEEFKADPDVRDIEDQIHEIKDVVEHGGSVSRSGSDPARIRALRKIQELNDEYRTLWSAKYDSIKARLVANPSLVNSNRGSETIAELEESYESLGKLKDRLARDIQQLEVQEKATNTDTLKFALYQHELNSLMTNRDLLNKNLARVEFESNQEQFRVNLVDQAQTPKTPSNNKRLKYMAVVPAGILCLMLGLFLLLEVKAERVADPSVLQSRVRSEVYALPPLPTARSLRKLPSTDAEDQVEQFIQRLDHLRFAVCGESAEMELGRCVIITSAIGGEGKTTLAAQLAARCGSAGMTTLLIDADLRRTSLARLLDIPDGIGLSDVLKEEAAAEDAIIPVQGGAFHVLPAGTPVQDTSRILQSKKLGLVIASLRQVYDLVIVDSPPVLPVPDALILGRWADGAVLAARYDISRFPQVERARRQLDNAGIPVLGTVINGMRNSDTYYGRYTYSRRRSSQADSSNTI